MAVKALGRLVSTARTRTPTITCETCHCPASDSAVLTIPSAPRMINATARPIRAFTFQIACSGSGSAAMVRSRARASASVGVKAPAPEQDHVGDRDQEKGHRRDPGWDQVQDQEAGDRGGEQRDGALDSQRPPGQVDCAGQHCAGADHRGQVEDVRAEDHSHAHPLLARRESDQGGGELRAVCGQGREQADEGLGEPEPGPDVVEPVGEQRGRRERDGDREDEQR